MDNYNEDIFDTIVEQYIPAESRDHKTNKEEEAIPKVTCSEAIFYLQ